jgi:hypothetical protein
VRIITVDLILGIDIMIKIVIIIVKIMSIIEIEKGREILFLSEKNSIFFSEICNSKYNIIKKYDYYEIYFIVSLEQLLT